jgi:hypothetical protein
MHQTTTWLYFRHLLRRRFFFSIAITANHIRPYDCILTALFRRIFARLYFLYAFRRQ